MNALRSMIALLLAGGTAFAFQVTDDPVMKARTQRAAAQGISEGDLPPVPRTIAEPPPLPPPETNYKDTHKGRVARARHRKKGRHSKTKKHSAPKKSTKKHH